MSCAFLVGCSTVPEVAGEAPKSSTPNLFFFPETQANTFPTLLQGLTRNLFRAPDFVSPPTLRILASLAGSICKWYHLSAYCHSPPAHPFIKCLQLGTGLPCPACSIVPADPGEGAGRERRPRAGRAERGGAAARGQWHGQSDSSPSPPGSDRWPCGDSSPRASPQTLADIMGQTGHAILGTEEVGKSSRLAGNELRRSLSQ